jgi:ABC-type antimicrobial peptide transport system permease subunit
VRWRRPEEKPRPAFYLPVAQHIPTVISVVARTSLDLSSFSNVAHSVMRTVDPDQPIERVMAIDELVQESTAERRSAAALGIGLGIVAMVLGAVGIFAAVETAVAERLREIALRVALGASRLAVWWLAMRQGFVPVSVGLALGGVLGMWLGHALRSFLFEVDAFDPLTLAGIALSVAVMTVLACWLPARQALCVEPMLILRRE